MITNTQTTENAERVHRQFKGVVVSAAEQKTVHVLVKTIKMHSKYSKQYTTSRKYAVHDEKGLAAEGDAIVFEECRPLSKTKRWRIVRVIK
ncbi:MAG: 30S ribosomal protein S17 [Candidatus Magasanikbacteria bacterium]